MKIEVMGFFHRIIHIFKVGVQLFILVSSPSAYVGWINFQGCLPSQRGRKLFLAMSGIKGIL